MLIDTHAHLDDKRFKNDLDEVVDRARVAGVVGMLAVATTRTDSEECLALVDRYPMLRASVGIHPNHAAEAKPGDWERIVELAMDPRCVAIGETGLDRHWDVTAFHIQEEFFDRHLELSHKTGLPVVVHTRDCDDDMLNHLQRQFDRNGPIRGVMHSFTGGPGLLRACLDFGMHISFAGMLTYKSASILRDLSTKVPLDRLLVETDCPYLAPEPKRGQRNEPALVVHTARCLAEARGLLFATLAEALTKNAKTLFSQWNRAE